MKLVFDLETIGQDFDSMDATSQSSLTRWIKKEADGDEAKYNQLLETLKSEMGFSPLTGEIIAIGVLDIETNRGAVYFSTNGVEVAEFEENGIKYQIMDEPTMLKKFWELAAQTSEFITFNGRAFDAPWLLARSAKYKIKPSRNLMEGRYAYQQRNVRHVDLQDELSFFGALQRKGSLHMWCRLFDIKSPKEEGVDGDQVARLYKEGHAVDIAKYNAADLFATAELYKYWDEFLRF